MSWAHGSRAKVDRSGPSMAEVAAMERAAPAVIKALAEAKARKKGIKKIKTVPPLKGHAAWLQGFRAYRTPARIMAARRAILGPLLIEQEAWLSAMPRNRHERRKRTSILKRIQWDIDQIPS